MLVSGKEHTREGITSKVWPFSTFQPIEWILNVVIWSAVQTIPNDTDLLS